MTGTGALVALAAACASGPGAPAPQPAYRPAPATGPARPPSRPEPAGLSDRGWGQVQSGRFLVVLSLPERRRWLVEDERQPWLEARHPPSQSRLSLRTWRASRLVRPDECEQQVRLWRPDTPLARPETVIDERQLDAPEGYRTRLTVGVRPLPDARIEGFALAFGAAPRRCLALVYTTQASGHGAEEAVGARLHIIADGVLPRLHACSVEERGQHERVFR